MLPQKKPGMLLFCKCQGKLIYHLTVEIQVAVGNVKNLLNKANEELHAAAETVYGRSLTHLNLLYLRRKPLLCRSCE